MSVLKKTMAMAGSVLLLALLSGCGGIQGSKGISPASFLIPGMDLHSGSAPQSLPPSAANSAR